VSSNRPRSRVTTSNGPTTLYGAVTVDRYLRALDGALTLGPAVFDALEHEFVFVAKSFSSRRGISYDAWREVGVSALVLQRADIPELETVAG
jgi:hypothetical protein